MADHDARRQAAVHILSLAGFLVLWAFVASDLLPRPLAFWRAFLVEIAVENYFGHLAATLARVAAAFTVVQPDLTYSTALYHCLISATTVGCAFARFFFFFSFRFPLLRWCRALVRPDLIRRGSGILRPMKMAWPVRGMCPERDVDVVWTRAGTATWT